MIIGINARHEASYSRQQSRELRAMEWDRTPPVHGWGTRAVIFTVLIFGGAVFLFLLSSIDWSST